METKVAIIKDINKDIKFIEEAGDIIRDGGTVAFPTETVYGLGANALDEEAVKKAIDDTGYKVLSIETQPYEKKKFSLFGRK